MQNANAARKHGGLERGGKHESNGHVQSAGHDLEFKIGEETKETETLDLLSGSEIGNLAFWNVKNDQETEENGNW